LLRILFVRQRQVPAAADATELRALRAWTEVKVRKAAGARGGRSKDSREL